MCKLILAWSRFGSRQGCELINQQADDGEYLENIDVILGVMDMDNNDSIDINEFFEVRVDRSRQPGRDTLPIRWMDG